MNFAHAEVATLDPTTMRTLCEEYMANNYIDPETSERLGVKRGLRNPDGTGVLAGLTNVCDVVGYKKDQEGHVIPTPGKLIYRGVNINEIVEEAYRNDRFVFEEVIWLLLFGSLPTQEQLDDFCEILAEHRALPEGFMDTMNAPSPNIMNKLQRCVLGLYSYDEHAEDLTLENILNQSINLIASMPTMMVNAYQMKRRYYDKQSMFFHLPKPGQSTAEHILSTYRPDQKFTHEEAKLLDMCLLVHADHGGGNCSTFTTRVLSSSGTDTYSAIAAGIGALKGPKHGGANLMVNRQLQDVLKHVENPEDDDEVREYLRRILRKQAGDGSGLIYGMGHAVYTISDPREVILKQRARHLAYEKGFEEEYNMLCSIERLAPGIFAEEKGSTKPVCANVDLFSGLIYNMLGISEDLYTPLFAIARVPGWCAHRVEEVVFANRIIRPAYKYLGVRQKYKRIECTDFAFDSLVRCAGHRPRGRSCLWHRCRDRAVYGRFGVVALCGIGRGGAGRSAHRSALRRKSRDGPQPSASGRSAGLCRSGVLSGGCRCAAGGGLVGNEQLRAVHSGVHLRGVAQHAGPLLAYPFRLEKAYGRAVSGGGGQCAVLLERADALYGEQLQLAPGGPHRSGVAGAGSTVAAEQPCPGAVPAKAGKRPHPVRRRSGSTLPVPVLGAAPCSGPGGWSSGRTGPAAGAVCRAGTVLRGSAGRRVRRSLRTASGVTKTPPVLLV